MYKNTGDFEQLTKLFNNTPREVLDQVADTKRLVREKAIDVLIKPLNQESKEDILFFQSIPLGFLKMGDTIGAIWFIETVGKLGNMLPWEVIKQVYNQAIADKDICFLQENDELDRILSQGLTALFQMFKTHPDYKNDPRIFLLMGNYEEKKGKSSTAISHYEKAMRNGLVEGYIASANIYEERDDYKQSLLVLKEGWSLYPDIRILEKMIFSLCKAGEITEALERYEELKKQSNKGVPSFLIYKGIIENDADIKIFEEIMAEYFTERSFVPNKSMGNLAKEAALYIEKEILFEEKKMNMSSNLPLEDWTPQNIASLKRWLYLIQTDILTLGNERYLEQYVTGIRKLGIEGDPYAKDILWDFFAEYPSQEVHQEWNLRNNDEQSVTREDIASMELLENISMHIGYMGELFYQGDIFDMQKNAIIPLIRDTAKAVGEYDDAMEEDLSQSLSNLNKEANYYESLRPDTQRDYEEFLHQFDEKYGVYYRRHIQCLAVNIHITPDKYPEALKQHPDVAFLFYVHKLLSCQMFTDNPEELEKIVMEYSLYKINIGDALLLGTLLFDISIEYALSFLINYPHMLDIPQALYIITECLRSVDPKTRDMMIEDLHAFAVDNYNAKDFFEHIDYTFDDIHKHEPTDEDYHYMLLTNGNIAILQEKESIKSILNFETASKLGSQEGFLQAGESYESIGEYDKALNLFEQAFCQNDTLSVATKTLNCAINSGRFDIAQKYIEHSLRKGYEIGSYIIAFHLGQGNTRLAFLQTISMVLNKTEILDRPAGVLQLLFERLSSVLNTKDNIFGEGDELKIYASFLVANLVTKNTPEDSDLLLSHWAYIISLCDSYEGEVLHEKIQISLQPFVGDMEIDARKMSSSDISVKFLQTHAKYIYATLKRFLKKAQIEEDVEKIEKAFDTINEFSAQTLVLLQRFPDTEEYTTTWRKVLSFRQYDNTIILNMPETIQ